MYRFFYLENVIMPKVESYEERNYNRKKAYYDVIAQVLQDLKVEHAHHGWNLPVQEMKGVTSRYLGEGNLEITYHRFEVCTIEGLARNEDNGKKFIEGIVKELKKRFRKVTKKALKLKKIREDQAIDKYSRLQADTSWMLGSSRYGYGARPVGRYLVRNSCIYEFDTEEIFGNSDD